MLFSLIHTETGSASVYKLFSFECDRLIQSLFGYHYLTSSLMECCSCKGGRMPNDTAEAYTGYNIGHKEVPYFLKLDTAPINCRDENREKRRRR